MSDYADTLFNVFEVDPELAILDDEQVAMLQSAGEGFLEDLVDEYSGEVDQRIERISESCRKGDLEALRIDIHYIAGSSANIGLLRLAELCRNIEMQIKEDRFAAIEKVHMAVGTEYAYGLAELCGE